MMRWVAMVVLTALCAVTCRPGVYKCKTESDCADRNVCMDGQCLRTCRTQEDCNTGTVCTGLQVCVPLDGGPHTDGGADSGMDAAVEPDAGQNDDGGASDAGTLDASEGMDAAILPDAAPAPDAGGPRDAGVRACERAVDISYQGPTVTGAVVVVPVPVFSPLQGTGGNLRFRDVDGQPLPFWIQRYGGGFIVAQVRLPVLPMGGITIVAGGCGMATDPNGSSGVDTFDYFSTFDTADKMGWTSICNHFSSEDEDCTVTVDNALPPPRHVEFRLRASCMSITADGVDVTYGRAVTLPQGSWMAEDERNYTGAQWDALCLTANGTDVKTSLVLGMERAEDTCTLAQCGMCTAPWGARAAEGPATFDGGIMYLSLFQRAGDCASLDTQSRFVRVKRALSPPPVVTVTP